ncbi:hypothetical protein HMPREF0673_00959 [Leyella stercorea DSM 18206]|uniref:Uncharacterized protein n=1 Tax=Leyella stercorea DSM 18206 TaxID=1002367 RepID=G6AWG1_9BACT|nr:hypothetical protein HMPREF0673_00959 [Leyella stercorea DSM 18206]
MSNVISYYRVVAGALSVIVIMIVAAIITPPDLMTLVLITIPLYLLYEVSVRIVKIVESK